MQANYAYMSCVLGKQHSQCHHRLLGLSIFGARRGVCEMEMEMVTEGLGHADAWVEMMGYLGWYACMHSGESRKEVWVVVDA